MVKEKIIQGREKVSEFVLSQRKFIFQLKKSQGNLMPLKTGRNI